jgi:hypothetical protein
MLLRVYQIKLYKKAEEDGDPDLYLIEYEDGDMEVCSRYSKWMTNRSGSFIVEKSADLLLVRSFMHVYICTGSGVLGDSKAMESNASFKEDSAREQRC